MNLERILIPKLICFFLLTKTEAVLNFKDEHYVGYEADRYNYTAHPCNRVCEKFEQPKICYYVFVVEMYTSMSKACYNCPRNSTDCKRPHCIPTDGIEKTLYTVNRQMPGPTVEVCKNDIVVVDVRNTMLSDTTTIHWHGFKQYGTPYMDGVPYVTQCPILPGQTFRYEFNATTDGTFFWHSHIGNQRTDGLFGALIVHPSFDQNPHKKLYDYDDQMMIINDWAHIDGDSGEIRQYFIGEERPDTILINGMGRFRDTRRNISSTRTPLAVFTVKQNKRHRFRLINSGAEYCPIEMSIDGHTMMVISLDSSDIVPVEVDMITTLPGERVDFIVNANKIPGNYYIRMRGYGNLCEPSNTTEGAFQTAILRYNTVRIQEPRSRIAWNIPRRTDKTRVLNPFQSGTESSPYSNISIPLLNSIAPNDPSTTRKVDQQIFINFDFYPKDNYDFHRKNLYGFYQVAPNRRIGTFQLNHISLKLPNYPLLSQYEMIKPGSLCNATNIPSSCQKEQCACTHVIELKLNSVVELIFVDEGRYGIVNHPLHLHGHFFRVVAEVNLKGNVTIDRIKKMDREGKIIRRLDRAPIKDTIKAPGGGYTIVRFYANNPGYWFFHCHFEQHNNIGMALIFKVGEHHQFPQKPKNFPTCGNFVPDPFSRNNNLNNIKIHYDEVKDNSLSNTNNYGISNNNNNNNNNNWNKNYENINPSLTNNNLNNGQIHYVTDNSLGNNNYDLNNYWGRNFENINPLVTNNNLNNGQIQYVTDNNLNNAQFHYVTDNSLSNDNYGVNNNWLINNANAQKNSNNFDYYNNQNNPQFSGQHTVNDWRSRITSYYNNYK